MAKNRMDADVVISNEKLRGKHKTSAPVVSEKVPHYILILISTLLIRFAVDLGFFNRMEQVAVRRILYLIVLRQCIIVTQ